MDLSNPMDKVLLIIGACMVAGVGILGMLIPMTVDLMSALTEMGADYSQWNATYELVITVAIFATVIAVLYTFVTRSTKK